jgi:hypothetical protein
MTVSDIGEHGWPVAELSPQASQQPEETDGEKVGLVSSPVGNVAHHIDGQFVHSSLVISRSSTG